MGKQDLLTTLKIQKNNPAFSTGLNWGTLEGKLHTVFSPIDGEILASVHWANLNEYEQVIQQAQKAFPIWQKFTAPKRGEIIRQVGNKLREYKEELGELVTLEMGKSIQEGLGEVQEMIDICDFAVGLSRQLHGFTMHSERPLHRMYEQYHPLGLVGVISAFNFPVAVWAWNTMLAAVCGDVCIWKPSEKTPLTAIACQHILADVLKENDVPEGVFSLLIGDATIGQMMSEDKRIPLISATGSTQMGKKVGRTVGERLGKSILELGGNNALIITENADLDLALNAVVFGSVGTCGQRCTSTRRLIVHENILEQVKERLLKAYQKLTIGNPLEVKNLVGPLIDEQSVQQFSSTLQKVQEEGGKLLIGGEVLAIQGLENGNYVSPAIVEAKNHYQMVQQETFAPILYLLSYEGEIENAITIQNDVVQGLSSAIFSTNIHETETFLAHWGSDCGIANVNIGTSGAEIGGAFGGEKETGGGRESGSDAWKAYMRRQTNTINYGKELPLSQGIKFEI